MKNIRNQFNKVDRRLAQESILSIRKYILLALKHVKGDKCFKCGVKHDNYDIHHKVYNPDITIKELELACQTCHDDITFSRA